MRKLIFASLALTLVACAKGDDAPADTAVAAAEPAAPALTATQALYAGTWAGRSYSTAAADTGTPWTMTYTAGPDGGLTATLRFAAGTEDIPVRVTEISESGIRTEFGPYRSLVANTEVSTTTDGRIAGDSLFGSFVATPTAGGEKISGRFAGRRQ